MRKLLATERSPLEMRGRRERIQSSSTPHIQIAAAFTRPAASTLAGAKLVQKRGTQRFVPPAASLFRPAPVASSKARPSLIALFRPRLSL
jgi:hypothetical protein